MDRPIHEQTQFPFQTITLTINNSRSTPLLPNVKLQQYHHLLKMKKVLVDTEQKMENRINLFRKASQKIVKRHETNFKVFSKIEAIRGQSPIHRNKQPRPLSYNRQDIKKQSQASIEEPSIADKLYQQRTMNARSLKEERRRFKVVIEEQKKIDLERKLQSANGIRKRRHNGKKVRQQIENERREYFQKQLVEKFVRERQEFMEIEKRLSKLQTQEEEALLSWKKTLEERT